MKYFSFYIIISIFLIIGIFTYQNWQDQSQKPIQIDNKSAFLEKVVNTYSTIPTVTDTDEHECDNYKDIQNFEKPVPIIWIAKLDGCLMSCYGASFTRVPSGIKYPRFAGYYPDKSGKYNWDVADSGDYAGSQIPDKFLKENLLLKIYGKWTGIDADHPFTVFENKCVPFVEIEKIEAIK